MFGTFIIGDPMRPVAYGCASARPFLRRTSGEQDGPGRHRRSLEPLAAARFVRASETFEQQRFRHPLVGRSCRLACARINAMRGLLAYTARDPVRRADGAASSDRHSQRSRAGRPSLRQRSHSSSTSPRLEDRSPASSPAPRSPARPERHGSERSRASVCYATALWDR